MKKLMMTLFAAAVCQGALASGIDVDDAWARETVEGMKMGGVFMHIENESNQDDVLLGGSTSVAKEVQIHNHINDNGVMRMREVEGGLTLPKGKTVALKPGGYHIMLMGLNQPLKAGDEFKLTLNFKNAGKKTVEVDVHANAGGKHGHHDHHGHHHHKHGEGHKH